MIEVRRVLPQPSVGGERCGLVARALLSALVMGCSSFDGGSDVLTTPALAPASARGSAPGSDWSCLGTTEATPLPIAVGQGRVVYSVQALDFTTRQPSRGLMARACALADVQCAEPVTPWLPTDDQGWIDLTLSQGFAGYLEFQGEGRAPGTFYLGEPLSESTTLNYPIYSIAREGLVALAGILGITLEPQLGLLGLRSFDCNGVTAPDVTFSKLGVGERWYFADGLPTVTATTTGSDGYGGFANVPPGVASVDALAPTGVSVSGARSMVVRPDSFSLMYVWPPGAQIAPPGPPPRSAAATP